MAKQRTIDEYRQSKEFYTPPMSHTKRLKTNVEFVNEVEVFNKTFGKPNNYNPVVPEKKEWQFVYDFVLEELEEYREACERGDIVEILGCFV